MAQRVRLGRREREMAPRTGAAHETCDPDPAELGPKRFVFASQSLLDAGREFAAARRDNLELGVDRRFGHCERVAGLKKALKEQRVGCAKVVEHDVERFEDLHLLELRVLERRTLSGQGGDLKRHRLLVTKRRGRATSGLLFDLRDPSLDRADLALELVLTPPMGVALGSCRRHAAAKRDELGLKHRDCSSLVEMGATVAQLIRVQIGVLQLEQAGDWTTLWRGRALTARVVRSGDHGPAG